MFRQFYLRGKFCEIQTFSACVGLSTSFDSISVAKTRSPLLKKAVPQ
jgi:hypothetical protein